MTEKYELTPENCVSKMADDYRYHPELILRKFARQFEFLACDSKNTPEEKERLIRLVLAFENLAKRIQDKCKRCNKEIIDGNAVKIESDHNVYGKKGELICSECSLKTL